jgi:hypothetical protein
LLLSNSDSAAHEFELPEPRFDYSIAVDTHRPECRNEPVQNNRVAIAAHSFIVVIGSVALQDIQTHRDQSAHAQQQLSASAVDADIGVPA